MKTTTRIFAALAAAVVAAPLAGLSQTSYHITFDEASLGLQHGSLFSGNEYAGLGGGVTFKVRSNGYYDQLAIFDTAKSSTADYDLETPFIGGNLAGRTDLGNALIIAENIIDRNNDGILDSPDDEGRGGSIYVAFANDNIGSVGFSLYDTPETSGSRVSIVFYDSNGSSKTWLPADLIAHGSGVAFSNHYGNEFNDIKATQLGLVDIKGIAFNIESGALDSLTFETIPEPSSAALLGLGALGMIIRRKR